MSQAHTSLFREVGLDTQLGRTNSRADPPCLERSMDSWPKGLPAHKKVKHPEPKQVSTHEVDDIRNKIIELMAKLTLKHDLAISQLEAATFRTILSTRDDPYLIEHQNAVQEFLANTQHLHKGNPEGRDARANQTRTEDEGEPHIYGWSAMILAAIADESAPKDSQEILKQHAERITDPKMLLDLVFVCRTRRCYDKRQLRVHFSVHSSLEPVLAALTKCFVNRGAKLKRGLPPKSGGARELQRLLSELEGIGL